MDGRGSDGRATQVAPERRPLCPGGPRVIVTHLHIVMLKQQGKQPEEEKIRIAKFGRFHQNLKERAERKTLSNSRLLNRACNKSEHT